MLEMLRFILVFLCTLGFNGDRFRVELPRLLVFILGLL